MKTPFTLSLAAGLVAGVLAAPTLAADNLAGFHNDMGGCQNCHSDANHPTDDNLTFENEQCQSCHGDLAEVAESEQNVEHSPHLSHLPGEPACTSCHSGHEKSVVYCDSCHSFEYDMPFGGKWERQEPSIDALVKANSDREKALKAAPRATTDIVVIGSGGAGLSAAVAAHDKGAKVIVLEKEPLVGGNTKLAAGGMNAAMTQQQKAKGIEDSLALMTEDTMKGGRNINDPALVEVLVGHSAASVDWLTGLGADLNDVGRMGGASVNRTHRPTGGAGVGAHVVQVLYDNANQRDIDIRFNSRAVEIIKDEAGQVKGVLVNGAHTGYYWIKAEAVVVATGGFGRNNDRVSELDPKLKGFAATNHPGATGDGLDVAKNAGAAMQDLEYIQAHPTLSVAGGVMVTEAVRGNGAILVNRDGKRFVNEITTRDKASAAILEQEGKTAFLIFDDSVRHSLKKIERYIELGVVPTNASLKALGEAQGIDGAELEKTVARYNEFVASGQDADFARPNLPRSLNQGSFYAIEVTPAVHHTMGGVKIDNQSEVLGDDGKVIKGMFAAGEVSGGVHGANRLGGNAISDIVTFGRLAGENAAKFVKQ
ncbi:flavocytochrome c [Ferrimonas balearica]|uniref:flavocytochrome c n=1 Tax=Ferrimonas balearica TaxID=44012 RepID=UPI001C99BEE2|nr:flavocytochrome c [Ferrimonas balearica]MBY5991503.1 flavocytochrome c [Ferrimonas balearica]